LCTKWAEKKGVAIGVDEGIAIGDKRGYERGYERCETRLLSRVEELVKSGLSGEELLARLKNR